MSPTVSAGSNNNIISMSFNNYADRNTDNNCTVLAD